jgi:hypothetical protein
VRKAPLVERQRAGAGRSEAEAGDEDVKVPNMVLAATLWYQWLAWALMIGAILTFVGLFVAYLIKVESPRYPKRQLR